MLTSLQIENYAIIRSLKIPFHEGLTAITGETGAGKSILMGALSLILGNRADTDVLFDKSRKCIVEAAFNIRNLQLQPWFNQFDLDYQDDTLIRREINEHGKSRAFINDTPVNLATMKTIASFLVDIHSQHQTLDRGALPSRALRWPGLPGGPQGRGHPQHRPNHRRGGFL